MANNTDSAQAASTIPSVVLATYTATPLDNEVQLDWQVSLEVDIDAYKVTRSEAGGPFIWLQNLGNNGYIPAQGNAPVDYQVFDTTAENGRTYEYRLLAVQTNSSEVDLGVREVTLPPYAALVNFNAVPLADEVLLTWEVSSEFEVAAYTIERGQNGNFIWLDGLGDNGYILATGDINTEANYSVRDKTAVNGQTYTYRLIAHESVTPGGKTAVVATRTVTLDSSRTIYMPVTIRP
jgi:hypothetical protein